MIASLWLGLIACDGGVSPPRADAPTWHADIAPRVIPRCAGCHSAGGVEFPLDSYAAAGPLAEAIADAVATGRMPPWLARPTADCQSPWTWKEDPAWDSAEIDLLRAWADAGAPEGEPVDPPPTLPAPVAIDADQTLTPDTPMRIDAAADLVMCHALDPALTEDGWLAAAAVEPGDRAIAHHAVLMLDPSGLGAANPGWFACFGGVGETQPLVFWAPGAGPLQLPADTAVRVPAGSQLLLQIHWHALGPADAVTLPSALLDWTVLPAREASVQLLGNAKDRDEGLRPDPSDRGEPAFRIPAGAPAHTETMNAAFAGPADTPLRIWAIGHHMHSFGARMESWLPDTRCLLATPRWDYDRHRLYEPTSDPPEVRLGQKLRIACTYNNTLNHGPTRETLREAGLTAPFDVELGGTALDEMCAALVGLSWER